MKLQLDAEGGERWTRCDERTRGQELAVQLKKKTATATKPEIGYVERMQTETLMNYNLIIVMLIVLSSV